MATTHQRSVVIALCIGALALGSSACSSSSSTTAPTTSTTNGGNALANLNASLACSADAKSIETAVAAYNVQNNTPIGLNSRATAANSYAGTEGAKLLPTYLNSWPTSNNYVVTLATATSGGTAGQVVVWPFNVHDQSTTPNWVVYDSESATTGCNGIRL